jgi:CBS domain containing-hemolysin-like protein
MDRFLFDHAIFIATTAPTGEVDGSVAGLIIYISVAIGISFLCSILEAVLLSTSLSHIELSALAGKRSGIIMKKLKQNVEQAISAILTLNTIAHTVGAAGAGAQAAAVFGSEWIGVISAILTFLILVFSEIIPKTLGAVYWKQLNPFAAFTIQFLVWLLYPIVWAFQKLTDLMAPKEREPTVTRSELEVLAQVSRQEGALEEKESLILKNLLKLTGVQVKDVMTPRTVMFSLQEDTTVDQVMQKYAALSYSRIPIYTQSLDDTSKFVLRHDILVAAAEDRDNVTMKELARPLKSIPESVSVAETMQKFMTEKEHVFLVFDEYGGTDGIITLEDTVESLIGSEITDESDVVADLRDLAKKRYEKYSQLAEKTIKADSTGGTLASDATGD